VSVPAPGPVVSAAAGSLGGALSPTMANPFPVVPFPQASLGGAPQVYPLLPLTEPVGKAGTSWPELLPRQLR